MNIKKIDFKQYASIVICIAGLIFFIYFIFKYILWALLPFFISWTVAFAVRPLTEYMHRKTGIRQKYLNFIFVFVALFVLGVLVSEIIGQVIREIKDFIAYLEENPYVISDSFEKAEGYFADISDRLHFFGSYDSQTGLFSGVDKYVKTSVENATGAFLSAVPKFIGRVMITVPKILIFCLVSVISAFYFSMDLKNVNRKILAVFPVSWQERGKRMKNFLFCTTFKYLRAYLLIMLITFSLLLIGFLVLKVRYSLILSALFALVDILPVLGVGTMLIPWGIFELATGDLKLGAGLLILYIAIIIIRQIIEPKIIGAKFGIHPLLTLFSMYLGLSLFGVGGMILGPVVAVTVKGFLPTIEKENAN